MFLVEILNRLFVIQKGNRELVVEACIELSYLWNYVNVLNLSENMRLRTNEQQRASDFSNRVLFVGRGSGLIDVNETWVPIPEDMLIVSSSNPLIDIINVIYQDLLSNCTNERYLQERVILAVAKETVDEITNILQASDEVTYLSSDSVSNVGNQNGGDDLLFIFSRIFEYLFISWTFRIEFLFSPLYLTY